MSVLQLFFLVVSLTAVSFGGANTLLVSLEREMVPQGFISPVEFATAVALGQSTPGPLAAFTTAVGRYALGLPGAIAATVALIAVSLTAVFLIGKVPARWFALPPVRSGLALMSAYAIALVFFLGYRILLAGNHERWAAPVAIMALVLVGRQVKAPTVLLILGSVGLGMLAQGTSWAGW